MNDEDLGLAPDRADSRRLALAAALRRHAVRRAGAERVPADASGADLERLARALGEGLATLERAHRVAFSPPYPGASAGVEDTPAGPRIVLATQVRVREAEALARRPTEALGVAFTALIPGRAPEVALAPPTAPVPPGWRPLA